jgi:hypothetical protein
MNGEDQFDQQANIIRLLRAAGYGEQPEVAPQMAPSPGLRLGPLKVGGGTLDNASASILQSMKGGMPRPRNTGEALGGGFLQGYAQARAGRAQARNMEYESKSKAVSDKNESRQKFLEKSIADQENERQRQIGAGELDRRQTERIDAAEERQRLRAIAQENRDRANQVYREQLLAKRQEGQMKLMQAKSQMPENPGKKKALSLSVSRMAMNDPDVKDFIVVRDYYNNGLKGLESKDSFGDLTAMRALARATDPRTGIREEEFRTFEGAVGELNRLGMLGPKMFGKGTLTEEGRKAVARELGIPYGNKKMQLEAAKAHYQGMAEMLELDPTYVLRDLDPQPSDDDPFAAPQAKADAKKKKPGVTP